LNTAFLYILIPDGLIGFGIKTLGKKSEIIGKVAKAFFGVTFFFPKLLEAYLRSTCTGITSREKRIGLNQNCGREMRIRTA
jgi:hypothetical protein